jgi:hypothetical protein
MPRDQAEADALGPGSDDANWQAGVLGLLLEEYPHQLSVLELRQAMLGENPDFRAHDAFERALTELVGAGLLRRCEDTILVARAARVFNGLELG